MNPVQRHYRIDFVKKLGIATRVINPIKEDAKAIILEETGIGADFVLDVTGSQAVPSIDFTRKGGTVVLFGVRGHLQKSCRQPCC